MNPIYRRFEALARRFPRRAALRSLPSGGRTTFGDLDRRSRRFARRLRSAGVRSGDVVMIVIGTRPAFFTAALATWALDAVLLPVDESLPPSEIASLERAFRPAVVVTAPMGRMCLRIGRPPGGRLRSPGAAMIRLTSGTTGSPRGARITASQAIADARAIVSAVPLGPEDVNVAVVPLNHTYGFDNIVMPLLLQGTRAVLLRRPLPALILRALRSRESLVLCGVPFLFDLLSRHPGDPRRVSGLRTCISAGAPLPRKTAIAFRARFGVPIRILYGSTETGGISFDAGDDAGLVEGRVGILLPGVRVRIDRAGLGRLDPGEGRIVVTGPAVGDGYLPEPSLEFAGGIFRTSDLGRLDAEGRLHLSGRLASLVNVSGRKVNPAEVERALLDLDGVTDAVAMGRLDGPRGETVHAWVAARPGVTPGRLRAALSRVLSRHKLPRTIVLLPAIPRTPRGKVDRLRLPSPR